MPDIYLIQDSIRRFYLDCSPTEEDHTICIHHGFVYFAFNNPWF